MRQDNSSGRQELAALFAALNQVSDARDSEDPEKSFFPAGIPDRQLALLTETSDRNSKPCAQHWKASWVPSSGQQREAQQCADGGEKLQTTLERRLGESFRIVSENLQQVHMAMGEMQLAGEVRLAP